MTLVLTYFLDKVTIRKLQFWVRGNKNEIKKKQADTRDWRTDGVGVAEGNEQKEY